MPRFTRHQLLVITYGGPAGSAATSALQLEQAVRLNAPEARQLLSGLWIVSTQEAVRVWCRRLMEVKDVGDWLLVLPVGRGFNGWTPPELMQWLQRRGAPMAEKD